ncbi:sphingosine 1-phosphate receptor 4 [Callorhinchus milii]|uniref:Sphingosine-1-phosphate receptor 4 n=1 Tax=Callorhinchus milii TaxID=7868 RepID=A0A4W3GVH3_CALMI|nr:sphingosine 1-phosphate receptor 4 [Callorhinchus milii]|eukprot:gi/632961772/ref/XP_007896946.1/ PREDICTED: sphingosine 1-phosphate receptor 4 [Callorhinchus milii]
MERSSANISHCLASVRTNDLNIILLHYNYTGKLEHRPSPSDGANWSTVVLMFISCFIVLENLLVFLAILNNTHFRRWVYYCIANITLSDLLAGMAYMVNLCLSGNVTFSLSSRMWLLREGVLFIALAASTFSLLIMAVERYTTMVRPVPLASSYKTYRVYVLIVLCWVMAFCIGLLPLFGWNCICNFQDCSTLLPLYSKSYILFCMIMFSLMIMGIVALYSSIYHLVKTSAKSVACSKSRKKSFRLLKIVCMIVGAFVVCWSPLFTMLLLDVFCVGSTCNLLLKMEWTIALAVLNSAINPIIASFGSKDIEKAILNLLCCCCERTMGPLNFLKRSESSLGPSTESSYRLRDSFRNSKLLSPKKTLPKPMESKPENSEKAIHLLELTI